MKITLISVITGKAKRHMDAQDELVNSLRRDNQHLHVQLDKFKHTNKDLVAKVDKADRQIMQASKKCSQFEILRKAYNRTRERNSKAKKLLLHMLNHCNKLENESIENVIAKLEGKTRPDSKEKNNERE